MKVEVIAEIGSNHDGSLGQAIALARAAVAAGADTVKSQDHRWQDIPVDAPHPPWMTGAAETRAMYVQRTCLRASDWSVLSGFVRDRSRFMVSPFSVRALEWHLEHKTLDAIKIASGQVTNRSLLELARDSGLPVYLSSGMSTDQESWAAYGLIGAEQAVFMQCVSKYPADPWDYDLSDVATQELYDRCIHMGGAGWGISDHTMGMAASLAAITLGATVIERHVGFDRRAYGSDAGHSLTMDEFAAFVREVRDLEKMLSSTVTKDEMARKLESTRAMFLHREPA